MKGQETGREVKERNGPKGPQPKKKAIRDFEKQKGKRRNEPNNKSKSTTGKKSIKHGKKACANGKPMGRSAGVWAGLRRAITQKRQRSANGRGGQRGKKFRAITKQKSTERGRVHQEGGTLLADGGGRVKNWDRPGKKKFGQ